MGDEKALLVMRQMFGEQGGRVAKILAQQGVEGLNQALADMDEQADKTMRITEKTSTLSAAFEQLEGVATLLSGTLGETLRESLLWLSTSLQGFIENTLQLFIEKHKTWVKWGMIVAAGLITLAATCGVLLLIFAGLNSGLLIFCAVLGKLFFPVKLLFTGFGRLLPFLSRLAVFAAGAGKAALSGLATAVMWLGRAFLIAGRFMLANPIVLVIAAVVAAGWWLYKNWGNVIGFLKDRWAALKNWWLTNPVSSAIIGAFSAAIEFCVNLPGRLWDLLTSAGHPRHRSHPQLVGAAGHHGHLRPRDRLGHQQNQLAHRQNKGGMGFPERVTRRGGRRQHPRKQASRSASGRGTTTTGSLGGSTSSQTTRGDAHKRHA